jgi:FdrA protein
MFAQAMRMLARDNRTEKLLLVSKAPTEEGVRAVGEHLPDGIPVVAAFVGWDGASAPFEVHPTLEAGATAAAGADPPNVEALEREVDARRQHGSGRCLLGLYSGGSLAHEAATLLEPELGPIAGNVGHGPEGPDSADRTHALFDLGEEEYTQGRPHPMVDLESRIAMLERAGEDGGVGCVLLDVVLGFGAHPDPAGGLATAIERVAGRAVVIAHVCGTPDDPQDSERQTKTLTAAGAIVAPSNAAAARLALRSVR